MTKENSSPSLYQKIYESIVENIKNDVPEKISVNSIAQKYGVNRNTADKAINMLEQNGWVRRIKRKGTFPVKKNSTQIYSINILYDHSSFQRNFLNSYPFVHAKLIESVFKSALMPQCNLQMLFIDSADSVERKREKLISLGARSGLIILDDFPGFDDIISIVREEQIPYVTFMPPGQNVNTIFHKDEQGSFNAVNYMIRNSGRKKIMFLSGNRRNSLTGPRFEAYKNALAANNIPFREELVFDLHGNENIQELTALLKSGKIDGVFAASFIVGERVYELMKILEIKIPDSIALTVFHDIPVFSVSTPSVTTVKAPLELIGTTMLKILMEMIDFGFREDIEILFDDELLIRKST